MANQFVAKNGLISQNNSIVSGSLTVTQGITGSLFGTASHAYTASFAPNYVLSSSTGSFATTAGNTFTGDQIVTGSVSINTNLRIQGSVNQGSSNVVLDNDSHVEGYINYAGVMGYNVTGLASGEVTFSVPSDISAEIGDYIVINDTPFATNYGIKAFKVASTSYDGSGGTLTITLEDTTVSTAECYLGSIQTRALTGGTFPVVGGSTHVEGTLNTGIGQGSHAEGNTTTAVGSNSYVAGFGTISNATSQYVIGTYNAVLDNNYAFIIGNGTPGNRSNLLYANGSQVQITGSLIVSGSSTFTNIGPAIFSGSVTSTQGFTGSFSGTATTASFITASNVVGTVTSASFATTASFALNAVGGGVTQIIAGTNISISPAGGTGNVVINSTGGGGGISQGKVVAIATGYSNLF